MNRNLLFVSLFSLVSLTLFAQKDFDDSNNIISNDSPSLKKKSWSKKNVVRLYPNPSYGKLSVISTTSTTLHFYIFDLEGTLIYQAVLNNKDRKTVDNLKKGTYMYDVFEKDESIEEGKIIVK
jgi:Secretion system C-terminal sorting domain